MESVNSKIRAGCHILSLNRSDLIEHLVDRSPACLVIDHILLDASICCHLYGKVGHLIECLLKFYCMLIERERLRCIPHLSEVVHRELPLHLNELVILLLSLRLKHTLLDVSEPLCILRLHLLEVACSIILVIDS